MNLPALLVESVIVASVSDGVHDEVGRELVGVVEVSAYAPYRSPESRSRPLGDEGVGILGHPFAHPPPPTKNALG